MRVDRGCVIYSYPFFQAIQTKDIAKVRAFIKAGAVDYDYVDGFGRSALHQAIGLGIPEIVELLIQPMEVIQI